MLTYVISSLQCEPGRCNRGSSDRWCHSTQQYSCCAVVNLFQTNPAVGAEWGTIGTCWSWGSASTVLSYLLTPVGLRVKLSSLLHCDGMRTNIMLSGHCPTIKRWVQASCKDVFYTNKKYFHSGKAFGGSLAANHVIEDIRISSGMPLLHYLTFLSRHILPILRLYFPILGLYQNKIKKKRLATLIK